jgi:hypothetical protein
VTARQIKPDSVMVGLGLEGLRSSRAVTLDSKAETVLCVAGCWAWDEVNSSAADES